MKRISRSASRSRSTEAALLPALLALLVGPSAPAQTLQNTGSLSFGAFAAGSGGTVTVSPAGARSAGAGVVLSSSGGAASAAQFLYTFTPGATFTITLPGTATLSDGSNTMTLDTFVSTPSGANIMLGGGGTQTISIGATLHVSAGQAPGSYSGSFQLTVNNP